MRAPRTSVFAAAVALLASPNQRTADSASPHVLLDDDFRALRPGMLSSDVVGARAEYHYLEATAPRGGWASSTFVSSDASQRAWRLVEHDDRRAIVQTYAAPKDERRRTHSMLVAGDPLWRDYTLETTLTPDAADGLSGVAFRYRHDRAFYFAGVFDGKAVLRKIDGGTGFKALRETTLAEQPLAWKPGESLKLRVTASGPELTADVSGTVVRAHDAGFGSGRIGLVSDVTARFGPVRVACSREEGERFGRARAERERQEAQLVALNPRAVPWRKLKTPRFGVARNLRFGDLDGDGQLDILFGQVLHHGPSDRASEVACLTAMSLEGRVLWQNGLPDPWKVDLTNDVAFQVHDLDGDGRAEVVYTRGHELIVADGTTGRTLRKTPTPRVPAGAARPDARFERILGDSLLFADLRGLGRPRDIILKDRYWHVWAFTDALEPLWDLELNTGHYPFAADVDGDGRDELAIGYSLVSHDGRVLWSLDRELQDHTDGVAIVRFRDGAEPRMLNAASDEGLFFADLRGRILQHHYLGHVQNPSVADYRPDLPGLETAAIDFWGNQGIVHLLDAEGRVYHDFEPAQHGSMMLPVNWSGRPGEYWMLSANPVEGGLFDGWGRRVVRFPADGHPDLASAVLDVTGDARDEILVWDPWELWIYTQSDAPRSGRLYKPRRNPLHNYSNYQATVSLPGWSER